MFKRTIYIGDIHGSKFFPKFIEKFDDGETKFFSLGDIFDRGKNSYENFVIIKKLYEEGKFDMVLGNHDLFFLLGYGFATEESFLSKKIDQNKLKKYLYLGTDAQGLLFLNGGDATVTSINEKDKLSYFEQLAGSVLGISEEESARRFLEITEFLFQFNIFKKDENKNLLVHGGIPLLIDGTFANIFIDGKMTNGLESYTETINRKFKELDIDVLEFLLLGDGKDLRVENILFDNKIEGDIKERTLRKISGGYYLSPTWYLNRYYTEENKESLNKIIKDNGINFLITGHCQNEEQPAVYEDITKFDKGLKLIRIDRHHKYNTFGFAIFEGDKLVQLGDSYKEVDLNNND